MGRQVPNRYDRDHPEGVRKSKRTCNCSASARSCCSQYKSAPFKVADGSRWIVVLGGREHMEELQKAPEDALSFLDAADDVSSKLYRNRIIV